jgi:hypothetical protein
VFFTTEIKKNIPQIIPYRRISSAFQRLDGQFACAGFFAEQILLCGGTGLNQTETHYLAGASGAAMSARSCK